MSGVNDDCYIHYYIQQLNTSIGLIGDDLSSPALKSTQWRTALSSLRAGLSLVLYFPHEQSGHVHGKRGRGLLVFILPKAYAGGALRERVPYMRSRSAWYSKQTCEQTIAPSYCTSGCLLYCLFDGLHSVRVATGFFTQPAHAQLVLL